MRKYILFLLVLLSVGACAQIQVDSMIVKQKFRLNGFKATAISNDTSTTAGDSSTLITKSAARKFSAGGGGFNPSANQTITGNWTFDNYASIGTNKAAGIAVQGYYSTILGDWNGNGGGTLVDINDDDAYIDLWAYNGVQIWRPNGYDEGDDVPRMVTKFGNDGSIWAANGYMNLGGQGNLTMSTPSYPDGFINLSDGNLILGDGGPDRHETNLQIDDNYSYISLTAANGTTIQGGALDLRNGNRSGITTPTTYQTKIGSPDGYNYTFLDVNDNDEAIKLWCLDYNEDYPIATFNGNGNASVRGEFTASDFVTANSLHVVNPDFNDGNGGHTYYNIDNISSASQTSDGDGYGYSLSGYNIYGNAPYSPGANMAWGLNPDGANGYNSGVSASWGIGSVDVSGSDGESQTAFHLSGNYAGGAINDGNDAWTISTNSIQLTSGGTTIFTVDGQGGITSTNTDGTYIFSVSDVGDLNSHTLTTGSDYLSTDGGTWQLGNIPDGFSWMDWFSIETPFPIGITISINGSQYIIPAMTGGM